MSSMNGSKTTSTFRGGSPDDTRHLDRCPRRSARRRRAIHRQRGIFRVWGLAIVSLGNADREYGWLSVAWLFGSLFFGVTRITRLAEIGGCDRFSRRDDHVFDLWRGVDLHVAKRPAARTGKHCCEFDFRIGCRRTWRPIGRLVSRSDESLIAAGCGQSELLLSRIATRQRNTFADFKTFGR